LVSRRIRTAVREAFVGWTLNTISDAFHAEGFSADMSHDPQLEGARRTLVEQFYATIDWHDWADVRRYLRVVEGVLDNAAARLVNDPQYAESIDEHRRQLLQLLERDGFVIDDRGSIHARWAVLTTTSVQALPDESAIPGHLRRMWDAVEDRPEQSISAAKDAIESAAKHALAILGVALTGKEKFPGLVDRVQKELRLHPTTVAPDQKGADAIIPALGALATLANKVDEIRNLYGDGHGRPTKVAGLTSRHSRLVARCADAYVGMLLDTLEAPGAPWRRSAETVA
jgi:hypothetical protein